MIVAEIHFNHDTGSASNDAINLRRNARHGSQITAPEWANGGAQSRPVAYAIGAITGVVTIKVKFKGGPPGASLNIRAVGPGSNQPRRTSGTRQALGNVKKHSVHFNSAGQSALEVFELTGDLADAKVGDFETNWTWQALIGGAWEPFATTEHRTFLLPALPTEPWNQRLAPNIAWPWVDAMEKACAWAVGTATPHEAADAIAARINTHPKHSYAEEGTQFIVAQVFQLTTYLSELDDTEDGFIIDCSGVATVMVTFANLLGAGLMPLRIQNGDQATAFTTEFIAAVGADWTNNADWITPTWGRHEVVIIPESLPPGSVVPETALPQALAAGVLIYDASMHVDQSAPVAPIRMPLGSKPGGTDYRFKLVDVGDGDTATPRAVRPVI